MMISIAITYNKQLLSIRNRENREATQRKRLIIANGPAIRENSGHPGMFTNAALMENGWALRGDL